MSEDLNLLLVDDDETTRDLLTLMLGAEGWQVTAAADGELALAIINSDDELPSVILSDLRMPGLNGTAMADAIRRSIAAKGFPKTPLLIAMTATATEGLPEGFDDLLIKPFPPEDLLRRCNALWNGAAVREDEPSAVIAEAAVPDAVPIVDPEAFEKLRASMSPEQLRALYEFALADAETRVQRMSEAAAAMDSARFRSEAHALKGSCGMIGASHMRHLAASAEAEGPETQNTLTESKPLTEFTKGITQIRHMLERLLPR